MAGGWGTAKNKIRIGVFWDGIQISADGSQARITDPRIEIDRGVNIDDSSNSLSWSGGAVIDGSDSNINVDGSGKKRIKNVSGQWQTLEYGSTKTATFSASFSGVNYAGGTLTASKTITYPARAFSLPAAPSGLSVSGSGNSRTLTWTNNGTTPAPVASTIIRQSLNGGAFVDVATVAAPGNSTTLSNLPNNAKIVYRLYALNSTGESTGYVQSADIYTKPSAPSNASATKLPDGSIDVSYQDNSAYETGFRIQDSADGTSWADAVASTTSRPWNHPSPSTAVTHRYRVAALAPGGLQSDWSNVTNIIQLLAPPNAPTNLGPTTARSPAEAFTLTWKHNPTDSSPQSSREIQRRTSTDGGATWSGWSTLVTGASSVEAYTVAAGTFGAVRLEWQVRTKGQHADWSPWSASSFLTLTPRPLTTIVSPGTTLNSSRMVVQLGYSDAGGYDQTSATVRVFDTVTGGQVLSQVSSGAVLVADFSATPLPEGVYRVEASTANSVGLSSLLTTKNVTIDYLPPAVPEAVETAWNAEAGSLSIATSNAPGAGVTEIARNLATNPSFENTSGTVEVRRNLIQNPQGTSVVAGWALNHQWAGSGGTVTVTTEGTPVTLPDGTQVPSFRRKTWTVTPSQGAAIAWQFFSTSSNRGAVTAGKTYTVQYAWRKSFVGTPTINRFEVTFFDAVTGGTQVGFAYGATLNNPAPGVWQQDSIEFTVPAGATHCTVAHVYTISDPAILVPGATFDATAALAEAAPAGGKYFDGGYSPDSDLAPSWVGTANASASVLSAVGLAVYGSTAYVFSSVRWAKSGVRSARITPRPTTNDVALSVAGSTPMSGLSGLGVTFEAGKTYTVIATSRLIEPQGGAPHEYARRIQAVWNTVTGWAGATYVGSAQPPNAAGVTEQRLTFTLPANAVTCLIRLYGGAGSGTVGDVWWDDLAIVEGTYTGEFFDGDNTPDASLDVAWVGTANNSQSTLKTRATVDTVSQSLYRVLADGTRELVANLGVNDTALDETPITNGPEYVLVAWSADGAAAENFFDVDPDEEVIRWFYLWKPGVRARFRAAVQRKRNAALAVSVANYAGRPEAVSTYGEAITENTDYSMTLLDVEDTNWNQIRQVALTPGDVIARSPDGLRFRAALSSTEASDNMLSYEQATLQLRHVGG